MINLLAIPKHQPTNIKISFLQIMLSKPLQNLLCVHPEPFGHEEVDEGVVCRGCLAEQGGNDPVF